MPHKSSEVIILWSSSSHCKLIRRIEASSLSRTAVAVPAPTLSVALRRL